MGIFGYPLNEATHIAVKTIRDSLADGSTVQRVLLACFSDEVQGVYRAASI